MAALALISKIGEHDGKEVELRGWLYNKRSSGRIHFLELRDGTGFIQCVVVKGEVSDEDFEAAGRLTQESSLRLTGTVRADARAKGGYEITVKSVRPFQIAQDYPITPKEHGVDFLMDNRHLWIRHKRQHAILSIRHEVIAAAQQYLNDNGFLRVDSPILTPAACEGTTTLFETEYFEEKAYLSQSGQLYNEADAMAFGKVYCFGPTFRAEKSKTRRHLIEFWMLEPEMAWCDQEENQRVQEELVSYIVAKVLEKRKAELAVIERDITKLEDIKPPFPRLSYDDAIDILKEAGREISWGDDFGAPDETLISERFTRPVFVTNYPTSTDDDLISPVHQSGYNQKEGFAGPAGDHDLLRLIVDAVLAAELVRYSSPQFRRPAVRGIAALASFYGPDGCFFDMLRRVEVRLAQPQIDRPRSGPLKAFSDP